jgi:hypothetical protein
MSPMPLFASSSMGHLRRLASFSPIFLSLVLSLVACQSVEPSNNTSITAASAASNSTNSTTPLTSDLQLAFRAQNLGYSHNNNLPKYTLDALTAGAADFPVC